jgi:hypothetical protein
VWVTANQVNHGVAIEIEDAGVGMSADAVENANVLLATAPTPDVTELKDGAQVGLHVVAELAKREGLQVSLRRSAYGGLLAIVLLPERILASTGRDGAREVRTAQVVPVAQPVETQSADAAGSVSQTRLSAVGVLEPDGGAGEEPEEMEATVVITRPQVSRPSADTAAPVRPERPPLPHRRPQQHLAPELLEGSESAGGPVAPVRSPEEARNRFTRYQRGWAKGATAGRDDTITNAEQGRNA